VEVTSELIGMLIVALMISGAVGVLAEMYWGKQ
jgi:hypothetical protein